MRRYDDVLSLARDPETYSSALGMGKRMVMSNRSRRRRPPQFTLEMASMRVLIATHPPDHTKLRRLVSHAFTPCGLRALEPRVPAVCEVMVTDLLDAAERGEAELVHQLASPCPFIVIAELLGIPTDRRADFKR